MTPIMLFQLLMFVIALYAIWKVTKTIWAVVLVIAGVFIWLFL